MSTTIDQAFIKQFEREVHEAYQRQGSKLRNTVRTINEVNGSTAVFQKVGKGTASTKSTHGMVPVMNLDHSNVEVILQDYYAGDWVDRLDEQFHGFLRILPGGKNVRAKVFGGVAGAYRGYFPGGEKSYRRQQNQDADDVFQGLFHFLSF